MKDTRKSWGPLTEEDRKTVIREVLRLQEIGAMPVIFKKIEEKPSSNETKKETPSS